MKRKITISLILGSLLFIVNSTFAQLGKDGAKTVASTVTNTNEYTTPTADATAGNTFINVASNTLNSGGNFSAPLDTGDLIMIIQMQGATLNATTDSTWGSVLNYNNCGNYEFAEVLSTANSSTINLTCGLQNNYSVSGRVQVIRVPRYSSLTVNSGGIVSSPTWNGATGGVLAIEVSGNTIINGTGKIDVSGKGFRGGQLYDNNSDYGVNNYVWPTSDYGKEKGEGVGGYEGDYDIYGGRYCRGSGANGGGGGNVHNAGGGGGANGGSPVSWSGKGNPDTSNVSWISAWNLEYSGFAYSSSSGGGKGGYTFSGNKLNPLVEGPNNSAWGGDYRDNNGGWGGRPLDYSTGRIFLGGGGGAGDQNDNVGGAGGNGGGLVYLMSYGNVSGSGQVSANGSNGFNTGNAGIDGGVDGAGGAGAGGTIILNSSGAITGISVTADGGNGGNQTVNIITDGKEAEGPGGGGSGGYIATSNGSITCTANAGANGTTNSNGVAGFPANGATKGGSGTNNAGISNFSFSASNVTLCSGGAANLKVTVNGNLAGGTNIYWYSTQFGGTALASGTSYTTSVLTVNTTYYVGACPGTYRLPVTVTIDSVASNFSFSNVCLGMKASFNSGTSSSSGGTINQWSWNFGDGNGTSAQANPSYQYSTGGPFSVSLTVTDNTGCSATTSQSINVGNAPTIGFSAVKTSGCDSLAVQFTNATTNGQSYHWNFGDGDSSIQQTPLHNYISSGTYTVILSSASSGGCMSVDTMINMITIGATPSSNFTSVSSCSSANVQFTGTSTGVPTSWSWNFGDGVGTSSHQDTSYTYALSNNYNVTLIVSGAYGCSDTVSKNVSLYASPVVSFSAVSTTGCDSLAVQFTNATTNAQSYQWNFGDGDSSSQQTPLHNYLSPGIYSVILTALNGSCVKTDSIVNMISVNQTPVADFSYNADCGSKSVQLNDSSTGPITSWEWNFGDGVGYSSQPDPFYIYGSDTTYRITLIVSSGGGCADTLTKNVTFTTPPNVYFTANNTEGCDSVTVTFNNSSTNAISYQWYFGDGNSSVDSNPVHFYGKAGAYTVSLIATSPGGCSIAQSAVNLVSVDTMPTVDFSVPQTEFCQNTCINFTNLSKNGKSYAWTFQQANPPSSSLPAPSNICYQSAGTFPVSLTVHNGSCVNIKTKNNFITVDPTPAIPTINQSGDTLTSTAALTYQWYLNSSAINGATGKLYIATADGDYSVKVTNSNDCSSMSSSIHVVINGVKEFADNPYATIYPNPVTDLLQIDFSTEAKAPEKVALRDILGKVIVEESITNESSKNMIIDMRNMSKSVYFLTFYYANKMIVSKIIKE